jgi:D-alanyl-D-alanine carboxypeptidase
MNKTIKLIGVCMALFAVCLISSCDKESKGCEYTSGDNSDEQPAFITGCTYATVFEIPPTDPSNGKEFNYAIFQQLLMDSLTGTGGYQIAVTEGSFPKLEVSSGNARETDECPSVAISNCHKMDIASVTKILTATTTLKLLYDQGLTENDTIGPFLPPSWNAPADVRALRFRDMLAHRSGMQSANNDFDNTLSYEGLKSFVQAGTVPANVGSFNYLNANVALMRVIIPQLWKALPSCPAALQSAGEIDDAESRKYYEQAVRTFVLNPVGADGELDVTASEGDWQVLYYAAGDTKGGTASGDWSNKTGGGGWKMNATDMTKVIAGIFDGTIVNNTILTQMKNLGMGLLNQLGSVNGTLYGHSGDITYSGGKQIHSILLHNEGMSLSIAVNINCGFKDPNTQWLGWVVLRAYNGAWQ